MCECSIDFMFISVQPIQSRKIFTLCFVLLFFGSAKKLAYQVLTHQTCSKIETHIDALSFVSVGNCVSITSESPEFFWNIYNLFCEKLSWKPSLYSLCDLKEPNFEILLFFLATIIYHCRRTHLTLNPRADRSGRRWYCNLEAGPPLCNPSCLLLLPCWHQLPVLSTF